MYIVLMGQGEIISQREYNTYVSAISYETVPCQCGMQGGLYQHGSYRRQVKYGMGKYSILIHRLRCKYCQKTHAVLPAQLVPYSQLPVHEQISVIAALKKGKMVSDICDTLNVEEHDVYYLRKKYLEYWEKRIREKRIDMTQSTVDLVQECVGQMEKQFMQVKGDAVHLL